MLTDARVCTFDLAWVRVYLCTEQKQQTKKKNNNTARCHPTISARIASIQHNTEQRCLLTVACNHELTRCMCNKSCCCCFYCLSCTAKCLRMGQPKCDYEALYNSAGHCIPVVLCLLLFFSPYFILCCCHFMTSNFIVFTVISCSYSLVARSNA